MAGYRVATDEWPLVRVTYEGVIDDAAFERYLDATEEVLRRRERFVLLFDARRAGMPTARQRQRQADFIRLHEDAYRRSCERGVFVISNALIRGALTAILWLQPLPYPHEVVSTIDEAERVLAEQLGQRAQPG